MIFDRRLFIPLALCFFSAIGLAEHRSAPEVRPIVDGEAEVAGAKIFLQLGKKNPALNEKTPPPLGQFTGRCYEGTDMNAEDPKKAEKAGLHSKDPFGGAPYLFLKEWRQGDIEVVFKSSLSVKEVKPDGKLVTETSYALVPGTGAGDQTIEKPFAYNPNLKSWSSSNDVERYGKGYRSDIFPNTKINWHEDYFMRFGKTDAGEDFIVSRFVQTGKATFLEGKVPVERTIRIENYCILNRKK